MLDVCNRIELSLCILNARTIPDHEPFEQFRLTGCGHLPLPRRALRTAFRIASMPKFIKNAFIRFRVYFRHKTVSLIAVSSRKQVPIMKILGCYKPYSPLPDGIFFGPSVAHTDPGFGPGQDSGNIRLVPNHNEQAYKYTESHKWPMGSHGFTTIIKVRHIK